MADFKVLKKEMYCLPMDVRVQLDILRHEVDDVNDVLTTHQPLPDQRIEQHIFDADAIVEAHLVPVYGSSELTNKTPYFRGPITATENVSPIKLRGIIINATTAITEQWILTFSSSTAFSIEGNFSGAQGTGSISSTFITNNQDLTINSDDWVGTTANEGDILMLGVYTSNPVVRLISSMLATSFSVDAIYSLSESDSSTWSKTLYKRGMDLLKVLISSKSDASLLDKQFDDIANEAVNYTIDEHGRDVTHYGDFANDSLPFNF